MSIRKLTLKNVNIQRGDHYVNPYPRGFAKVSVPEGRRGDWAVEKFSVSTGDVGLHNLRLIRDRQSHRIVPPGDYTKLTYHGDIVMSDTPAEAHEHASILEWARGHVLLCGLGLGFVLSAVLRKPGVKRVTVIEVSQEVIDLVAPSYASNKKFRLVKADATEWSPPDGVVFDAVWHDIWSDISKDNVRQMKAMIKRYRQFADWQGCWSQEYVGKM